MYEEKCVRGDSDVDNIEELSAKVLEYCKLMASDVDKIREKYWDYVAGNFKIQMAKNQPKTKSATAERDEENPLGAIWIWLAWVVAIFSFVKIIVKFLK